MINLSTPVYGVVTLDEWIQGTDGNQYKGVWGLCQTKKAEDVIGCKTGSGQADFVIVVGREGDVVIPGCSFKAFVKTGIPPVNTNVLVIR